MTGGSRGIGAAVVADLRAEGWRVIAPARSELDLGDPDSVSSYLAGLSEQVDGIVLNAGVNTPARLGELSDEAWSMILRVNTEAAFTILSALTPGMADRGFGRIVAISSAYSTRARDGRAAYSSSKAATDALIRGVTVEYADRGVLANSVAPGFVDTDLTRANNTEETISRLLERVPRGRLAHVSEIARAVTFLMSPDNDYITGQTLNVDGGFSCT